MLNYAETYTGATMEKAPENKTTKMILSAAAMGTPVNFAVSFMFLLTELPWLS